MWSKMHERNDSKKIVTEISILFSDCIYDWHSKCKFDTYRIRIYMNYPHKTHITWFCLPNDCWITGTHPYGIYCRVSWSGYHNIKTWRYFKCDFCFGTFHDLVDPTNLSIGIVTVVYSILCKYRFPWWLISHCSCPHCRVCRLRAAIVTRAQITGNRWYYVFRLNQNKSSIFVSYIKWHGCRWKGNNHNIYDSFSKERKNNHSFLIVICNSYTQINAKGRWFTHCLSTCEAIWRADQGLQWTR